MLNLLSTIGLLGFSTYELLGNNKTIFSNSIRKYSQSSLKFLNKGCVSLDDIKKKETMDEYPELYKEFIKFSLISVCLTFTALILTLWEYVYVFSNLHLSNVVLAYGIYLIGVMITLIFKHFILKIRNKNKSDKEILEKNIVKLNKFSWFLAIDKLISVMFYIYMLYILMF